VLTFCLLKAKVALIGKSDKHGTFNEASGLHMDLLVTDWMKVLTFALGGAKVAK